MSFSNRQTFSSKISFQPPLSAELALVQTSEKSQDQLVEIHGDVFLDADSARALAEHLNQLANQLG